MIGKKPLNPQWKQEKKAVVPKATKHKLLLHSDGLSVSASPCVWCSRALAKDEAACRKVLVFRICRDWGVINFYPCAEISERRGPEGCAAGNVASN